MQHGYTAEQFSYKIDVFQNLNINHFTIQLRKELGLNVLKNIEQLAKLDQEKSLRCVGLNFPMKLSLSGDQNKNLVEIEHLKREAKGSAIKSMESGDNYQSFANRILKDLESKPRLQKQSNQI